MNTLLAEVLDAHGGLARWNALTTVRATIVSGGDMFVIKGMPQDPTPREMTVWLHEQHASVTPFGAPDQKTDFTADRISIEKHDGRVVAERDQPRKSFSGHELDTPWDPLDRAYFNGYALWTYLTTPFLLSMPGFTVTEIEPWREGDERPSSGPGSGDCPHRFGRPGVWWAGGSRLLPRCRRRTVPR
ncbi:hypothetical protein [Streptomyces mirabilis]|uniref:hypothetical protein n=1 Tax=Streptomyces mirabilis TaxID=68239 RepID=UPI0036DAD1B9